MHRFLSFCLFILIASTALHGETLRNPVRIPATTDPVGIHVADLNNDGLLDLYYGNYGISGIAPGSINIQLAQPDGTYRALAPLVLPLNADANCTPVDINSDGKLDLVCPSSNTVHGSILTLFGNGDGTFQTPVTSPLPDSGYYYDLFVSAQADLNADGHPDLILYDAGNSINLILLGDGTGHFTRLSPATTFNLPVVPGPLLTVADFNGDGIPDIFSGSAPGILLGKGDGTLHHDSQVRRLFQQLHSLPSFTSIATVPSIGTIPSPLLTMATVRRLLPNSSTRSQQQISMGTASSTYSPHRTTASPSFSANPISNLLIPFTTPSALSPVLPPPSLL